MSFKQGTFGPMCSWKPSFCVLPTIEHDVVGLSAQKRKVNINRKTFESFSFLRFNDSVRTFWRFDPASFSDVNSFSSFLLLLSLSLSLSLHLYLCISLPRTRSKLGIVIYFTLHVWCTQINFIHKHNLVLCKMVLGNSFGNTVIAASQIYLDTLS